ncbi:unnamed protein product [Moneuplotes crassus]|uniref:Uncharacterized protein n=2 Tax=Euplotes crassus TaxID=5936 RepID=A0AAD1U1J8_EUPCR|nr:unnamed protein product [Moneuplotes crassus]
MKADKKWGKPPKAIRPQPKPALREESNHLNIEKYPEQSIFSEKSVEASTRLGTVDPNLDVAYNECEKINQLIMEEKQRQQRRRSERANKMDNPSLHNEIADGHSDHSQEGQHFPEQSFIRRQKREIAKTKNLGDFPNEEVDSASHGNQLLPDEFVKNLLGSDYGAISQEPIQKSKFGEIKEYYQDQSLARNQLKTILDKISNQNSANTKKNEDKMLMELYLNSKSFGKDNSNSGESSSINFLARSPGTDKPLSPFEKRKAKLNESILSEVSEADKVELEGKLTKPSSSKKSSTRNLTQSSMSQKGKVIYLQKKEYLPSEKEKSEALERQAKHRRTPNHLKKPLVNNKDIKNIGSKSLQKKGSRSRIPKISRTSKKLKKISANNLIDSQQSNINGKTQTSLIPKPKFSISPSDLMMRKYSQSLTKDSKNGLHRQIHRIAKSLPQRMQPKSASKELKLPELQSKINLETGGRMEVSKEEKMIKNLSHQQLPPKSKPLKKPELPQGKNSPLKNTSESFFTNPSGGMMPNLFSEDNPECKGRLVRKFSLNSRGIGHDKGLLGRSSPLKESKKKIPSRHKKALHRPRLAQLREQRCRSQGWNNSVVVGFNDTEKAKQKRDRIKEYWKSRVKPNFRPNLDHNKKLEVDLRKKTQELKPEKSTRKFERISLTQLSSMGDMKNLHLIK